jgi:hypothetical protein
LPSVPHEAAVSSVHIWRGSAEPVARGVHRPSADGSAQLRQAPWQASAQQTPSTQKLLAQSPGALHGWPFAFGPQLPLTQECPAEQSASLVQRMMQAPLAHL